MDSSVAQVSDIPKVREGMLTDHTHNHKLTDTTDLKGLNENDICSMFGEQSLKQIIQQFSPFIVEVFNNLESFENGILPTWRLSWVYP